MRTLSTWECCNHGVSSARQNGCCQPGVMIMCDILSDHSLPFLPLQRMGGTVKILRDRLTMCRWMGSHFHGSIDFYGVAFSMELLEWGYTFLRF